MVCSDPKIVDHTICAVKLKGKDYENQDFEVMCALLLRCDSEIGKPKGQERKSWGR